ncbi:MAG: hypothetical protein HKN91_02655 [Acidimicrobiia bacterium]|nr:hypothetical protein [Acidimicrobiia bacterium]
MRSWALHVTALVVALTVVVALLAILVVGMLRSHAEILRKLHDLGAGEGTAAPFQTAQGVTEPRMTGNAAYDIAGATPAGGATAIRVMTPGTATLLAFMSTSCTTCEQFWPRFRDETSLESLGSVRLVIVTKGTEDEMPGAVDRLAPEGISLAMSSQAWLDYQVPGSPYFVMVDGTTGLVTGEGSAGDWDKLLDLMGIAEGDTPLAGHSHSDQDRAERVDEELADAGILPGDPQLYGEHELQADK